MPRIGLLRGCSTPVVWPRNRQSLPLLDTCGDKHGLVARKDGLAKGDDVPGFVLRANVTGAGHAVRLVGERFGDVAVAIAV